MRRAILVAALLVQTGVWCWFVFGSGGPDRSISGSYPLDDAWIHMVYGRNLAETGVPAYNRSIEPGFTSPLWMGVAAAAHLIGGIFSEAPPVLIVKLFGLLLSIGTTLLVFQILERLLGDYLPAATPLSFMVLPLLALDPHLAYGQVSGMETAAFSFLLLLCLRALRGGRHQAAGLAIALACLSRPEGLVIVPLLAVSLPGLSGDKRIGAALRLFLPTILVCAGWSGLCLLVSGQPLPNTFYAKISGLQAGLGRLPVVVRDIILPWSVAAWGLGIPLLLAGTHLLIRGALRLRPLDAGALLAGVAPWVLFLGTALSRDVLDTHSFYWSRYFLPALPLAMIPFVLGAARAAIALEQRAGSWAARALVIGVLAGTGMLSWTGLPASRALYAANCRDIDTLNVGIGRLIAQVTPIDAVVGTNDAGAIRYFGNRTTIDLAGLNNWPYLFRDSGAKAFSATRFTHLALSRFVQDPLKERNVRLIHRAFVANNSLHFVSPYWMELFEVIDPDLPK